MPDSHSNIFSAAEVSRIQHAYRAIFPKLTPALAEYWDRQRRRSWSCLSTDFHTATYESLLALHYRVEEIDRQTDLAVVTKGELLRAASVACDTGFSVGICPWTDHLLGETYSDDHDSVAILLGHDWYPIVTADARQSESPLRNNVGLRYSESYWPAVPAAILAGETVGLFFNLYPDFRPPGDAKCGPLKNYGYSYAQCLVGLDAMVESIARRFKTIKLISWGSNVWEALLPRLAGVKPGTLLSDQVQALPGQPLQIHLGGQYLPYLPAMHPSHPGNFFRAYHLRHIKAGFMAMQLGDPGPAGALTPSLIKARNIDLAAAA